MEPSLARPGRKRFGSKSLGRILPYNVQVAQKAAHDAQWHLFQRHRAIGLLLVAMVVFFWCLLHTNPAWIFPPGWWRF